jgi:nicotinic acid mononucleotide adenylyltransferase
MNDVYISKHNIQRLKHIQGLLNQLHPAEPPLALRVPGSPMPHGTIIVFPGSFNPPTKAHLALMKQAHDYTRLHEHAYLYAAFSKRTVDKENVERPLLVERIHLLDEVLKRRLSHTGILLFNRGLYLEQAQSIYASFTGVRRLLFLLGFDKIVQILDPRYYADRDAALTELFSLAELLVAPRGAAGENELAKLLQQPQNERFAGSIHVLPFDARYRNISSTRIREGQDGAIHDMPQEVRRFIYETHAYTPPMRSIDGSIVDYYAEHVAQLDALLASSKEWKT